MEKHPILLKKVKVHNLKSVDLELDTGELIAFTGVSGSGKSSLAFDTIYAEGQRRYIESLSAFARRYLGDIAKPDVEFVSGLSPTISIEQKSAGKNPRSTVGTMTEIYDYLRVLYARVAIPHCPVSGEMVLPQSKERIIKTIQAFPAKTKVALLAPFAKAKKGEFKEDFQLLLRKGFMRARVDGSFVDLSEEISLDKNLAHDIDIVIDRLTIEESNHSRIAESVTSALELGSGLMTVISFPHEEETLFSTQAYSPRSGLSYKSLEPQDFSFNSPAGMCPTCHGLGVTLEFDFSLILDPEKSIEQDCCSIASSYQTVRFGNIYNNLASLYGFNVKTPWKALSDKAKQVFLYGTQKKWTQMHFVHPSRPQSWTEYVQWRGVIQDAKERYGASTSDFYRKHVEALMKEQLCPSCQGTRLKPYPAAALLNKKRIHELTQMTVSDAFDFFSTLKLGKTEAIISEELLKEISRRLSFLLDVGLHYLTLDRSAPTLSGGEAQRVRLASQVGSGLVGVTYVLDEPSIGLHPRDNEKLIETLKTLRDVGNTVIVVEHDQETILSADRIVDVGPGPGELGGEILVNGTLKELLANKRSITGAYLSGKEKIAVPSKRRKSKGETIEIIGSTHHNLKKIDVQIPLGLLIAVTGVSGSGKSSLITDTLYPALSNHLHHGEHKVGAHKEIRGIDNIDKVIAIDQSPIGRTPRSNPATYIKIFDEIRALFSQLPESVAKGYQPGRFSFNVRSGACPECLGMGMKKIDMDFMEASWVPCPLCKNRRFDHETLSIYYKGKNIYDVLEMSVEEALEFFSALPSLKRKLEMIAKVGLPYIKLGQPSTTLSGGEAQRMKLAKELIRPATGKTFYILDEPTTGLHFHDIKALLAVLQELTDRGNSVLVIEHNTDVIKCADWIIDLGPEGGAGGGRIIAEGPPEKIAKMTTPTGHALKHALKGIRIPLSKEKKKKVQEINEITVIGAEQNNLKNIDLQIPRGSITVCTGPSGSGKSSLAFETVYAEGQRRYIESLSAYARQFVEQMPKPKVAQIEGLSPAIAIEQKSSAGNPRSTVGTMTEIFDYLRILFARAAVPYCPESGERIESITTDYVVEKILEYPEGEKLTLLAPLTLEKHEKFEDLITRLRRLGYLRIRLNKEIFELDESLPFDRKRKNEIAVVVDRLKVSKGAKSRLFEGVENATALSNKKVIVMRENGEDGLFNLSFAVAKTGKSYPEITPHTFSFNSAEGMCLDCQGLGFQYGAHLIKNEMIMNLTVQGLLHWLWRTPCYELIKNLMKQEGISLKATLKELKTEELQFILNGSGDERWMETKEGWQFRWLGIQPTLAKSAKITRGEIRQSLIPLLEEVLCHGCMGARLNALARNARLEGHSIASLCQLPIVQVIAFFETLSLDKQRAKLLDEVMKQIKSRLAFLNEVGLHYLSLDRRAPTLSNGEAQRIRLARQLGSSLTGVLYVLDEPTIGLHPQDNARLNTALEKLKKLGNTLLLVEHDPMTIATADKIFDFGPKAGAQGGHIIAQGSYEEILKNPDSLTGAYLSGRKSISQPKKRRKAKGSFLIEHGPIHNLKALKVEIPKGVLTCLTGVSGSGKSTLMHDVIRPFIAGKLREKEPFDKMIVIDQDPIGHTVRSDVGSYVNVLASLREFYASLGGARTKGLLPRHFSYNHRKGMCGHCFGLGYKKIEMLFLPTVRVVCDECRGLRLNPESLEVKFHGKNFGELLNMTVMEARGFFEMLPKASRILDTLIAVGLDYLKLGQEMATLSGGEAQRMKLSSELSKRGTGKTLYLLDEPTTGLHSDDIEKLLAVLHRLVDKGNTMIVIEHNVDFIRNADFIIDLGPEGGEGGGEIIAMGTPKEIAKVKISYTGRFLKGY